MTHKKSVTNYVTLFYLEASYKISITISSGILVVLLIVHY